MFDYIKDINRVKQEGLSKSVDNFFPNFSTAQSGVIALELNNTAFVPSTISVFNSDANIYAPNFGNPLTSVVTPICDRPQFATSYYEILNDNRVNPYIIRNMKLISSSFNQFSRQIRLVKKTASGILCLKTFKPLDYFDVEQKQPLQVKIDNMNIQMDGSMGFEFDMDATDIIPVPPIVATYQVFMNTDKLDMKKSLYGITGISKMTRNEVNNRV